MANMLKHIVVVGNSISAWMSAAALSCATKNHGVKVSLCTLGEETAHSGNVSVRPEFSDFLRLLGTPEPEFMRTSLANFKLANHFKDWHQTSSNFYHAFGEYGTTVKSLQFSQFYARLRAEVNDSSADVYSLGAQLAKHNKFIHPNNDPQSILSTLSYGWNIDADAYCFALKKYSEAQNVAIIDVAMKSVDINSQNNSVTELQLEDGSLLNADLFIDCSHDNRLKQAISNSWQSWQSQLPDCEVISIDRKVKANHQPSSLIQVTEHGWRQEIPSQQKITHHYYAQKSSDCLQHIPTKNVLNQTTQSLSFGMCTQPWLGNCISLGLGAVSLPSICLSELDLTWAGLDAFISRFPAMPLSNILVEEYNRNMLERYNRAKDLTAMHFAIAEPLSGNFWQEIDKSNQSEELNYKLNLYKKRGKLPLVANEAMPLKEQYSLLMGMAENPLQLDLMAQQVPIEHLQNIQLKMERVIQQACTSAAMHIDYLQTYCYRREKSGV